jgi:predicted nucleic acid-binding protein
MRVYLDSAPIIYLVEQHPAFSTAVETKLTALGGDLVTGQLSWLEALVHPYLTNDAAAAADFDDFFRKRLAEVVVIDRAICDRAARIRATYPFKTPDALHLACAVEARCDVFVTNDQQLKQFTGITVEVI